MNLPDPSIALLFPGQGSQKVGMGRELAEAEPIAAQTFAQADRILGFPLSKLCWQGPAEVLDDTVNTQPALLTHSVALFQTLQHNYPRLHPTITAGHSVGEFSALVATGALTFEDALRLVRVRGEVMKAAGERNRGGMAAILGLTIEKVEALCGEISDSQVWVANDNCPGQVVISGEEQALRRAQEHFTVHGARKFVRLAVSIAAHSPLMESAQEDFQLALQKTPIQDPRFPLIGNTEARVLRSAGEIRQELNAQLTSRVRWTQSMRLLLDLGAELIFELGPGSVLRKLMRRIDPSASIMALDSPASFAQIDPAGAS